MPSDTPAPNLEGLAQSLESVIGANFDGEASLSESEVRDTATALRWAAAEIARERARADAAEALPHLRPAFSTLGLRARGVGRVADELESLDEHRQSVLSDNVRLAARIVELEATLAFERQRRDAEFARLRRAEGELVRLGVYVEQSE